MDAFSERPRDALAATWVSIGIILDTLNWDIANCINEVIIFHGLNE
jgi:hypothetical protein